MLGLVAIKFAACDAEHNIKHFRHRFCYDNLIELAFYRCVNANGVGDGKIFVYDVEKIFRVRTGEYDYDALQSDNE